MLLTLSMRNVALIESLTLEFQRGLHVVTGETGAGKSIIIDSLNMLKGERTPKSIIRAGESKARVDGVLEVGADISESLSDEYGIECDGEILISREISADGKGSVRVNGMPMPLAMLRSMCENLINIHGQHDNTSLLSPKNHIGFLDSFGAEKISPLLADYKKIHSVCTELEGELSKTDIDEREAARRADLLKYQLDEIDAASLAVGEDSELAGKSLMELSMPQTCNVVCISRGGHTLIPRGQTRLHGGDVLLVVTLRHGVRDLRKALRIKD